MSIHILLRKYQFVPLIYNSYHYVTLHIIRIGYFGHKFNDDSMNRILRLLK